MGNCIPFCSTFDNALPIETPFKLPAPLPTWPHGSRFGSGVVDLGGLKVAKVSTFKEVWTVYEGGTDNLGATFFEPASIPQGFFMLGGYCQPNSKPLNGWVLVGKDRGGGGGGGGASLAKPSDYTLLWSSESLKIKQDRPGYFWLPVAPDGYTAVGLIITTSPEKPPMDHIWCVRSDFTEPSEAETSIWGPPNDTTGSFKVSSSRPQSRGTQALGVSAGTYVAEINSSVNPIRCLKNNSSNYTSYMPNRSQINLLTRTYSPLIYYHPKEKYLPSSVSWFFSNGALLYKKGYESNPVPVQPTGLNLPQDGSNDGLYWLDLPVAEADKETVKKGNLESSKGYVHAKPMYGGTFTDIAIWVFYPFNGPSTAKLGVIEEIPLGRIGEHIGDWEHVTLRVSNFDGVLWRVFFSQHSGGTWVDASELEYQADGGNRFVAYSSLNGHAAYSKPGLVLQGSGGIGIRNDTAKSGLKVDTAAAFSIVAVDYEVVAEESSDAPPPWLNYMRKWGPKITYNMAEEAEKVESLLPEKLRSLFNSLLKGLPSELFGEEGPTGPKVKTNWSGDEA
ncbi:hypothetical protein SAY86_010987 [Trapa natans]|uniref:Vacuolar protein sorting-associated protein 62 n=1 Tax=Trapa natans TaxID=22666 RepID=A0AAN7LMI6_TRANT|nr:hypothetical protein SAY86_010987 [Trapa natans]